MITTLTSFFLFLPPAPMVIEPYQWERKVIYFSDDDYFPVNPYNMPDLPIEQMEDKDECLTE
jgi:hypothetical protein